MNPFKRTDRTEHLSEPFERESIRFRDRFWPVFELFLHFYGPFLYRHYFLFSIVIVIFVVVTAILVVFWGEPPT